MEKSDLTAGHHGVVTRAGDAYIIAYADYKNSMFLLGEKSYTSLDGYCDNLRHKEFSSLDIVSVFLIKLVCCFKSAHSRETVWQEPDQQRTDSEIEAAERNIERFQAIIHEEQSKIGSLRTGTLNAAA